MARGIILDADAPSATPVTVNPPSESLYIDRPLDLAHVSALDFRFVVGDQRPYPLELTLGGIATVSAVPEPGTGVYMAVGLALLWWKRRAGQL